MSEISSRELPLRSNSDECCFIHLLTPSLIPRYRSSKKKSYLVSNQQLPTKEIHNSSFTWEGDSIIFWHGIVIIITIKGKDEYD